MTEYPNGYALERDLGTTSSPAATLQRMPKSTDLVEVPHYALVSISPGALRRFARDSSHEGPAIKPQQPHSLRISEAAFWRLRRVNARNCELYKAQYALLESTLRTAVEALRAEFAAVLDQVILVSDELLQGVDFAELSYYGAALYLVMRKDSISDDDYDHISDAVFAGLDASILRLQVHLLTTDKWYQVEQEAKRVGGLEDRAITLLSREER